MRLIYADTLTFSVEKGGATDILQLMMQDDSILKYLNEIQLKVNQCRNHF